MIRLFSFILGFATVFGFAPYRLFLLPVLTVSALFLLWRTSLSAKQAAGLGFFFGLGYFLAGVHWVYISLHDFGAMHPLLAGLATLLFCAYLALFPALVGTLTYYLKGTDGWRLMVVMPALWVAGEGLRGSLFTGFPWLALGYSQIPESPLAGFAPVAGVYAVSLSVALSAGCLAYLLVATRSLTRWATAFFGACLAISGVGLQSIEWSEASGAPLKVSLLQGNIAQEQKFVPEHILDTLELYTDLVKTSSGQLIILPETALPIFAHQVPDQYWQSLQRHAEQLNGDVLVGVPQRHPSTGQYYNSVVSVGVAPTQVYSKHHLTPFGEFIPLRPLIAWIYDHWLNMPLADFSPGGKEQSPFVVAGQQVALHICYEALFGDELRHFFPQATLLANVSNDAWFGASIGPEQHLQIAQARALEMSRPMLRATNTGVTTIIDHRGREAHRLASFAVGILEEEVAGRAGATPYVRWGDRFIVIVIMGLLAMSLARVWFRGKG